MGARPAATGLRPSGCSSPDPRPRAQATGKTGPKMTDVFSWSFKDGKICASKHYWGNPGAIDALYAA